MNSKKNNWIVNGSIILTGIGMLFLYFFSQPRFSAGGEAWFRTSKVFPTSIDKQIPDSLSYSKHIQMRDSMGIIRDLRNGDHLAGDAVFFANIIGAKSAA